jgi:hypothetical protein
MTPRSANEVMHDVIYAAVVDAIVALKASAGGLPNNLVRNVGAIHANTTFADLPKEVQDAITTSTRAAFTRLLREGYAVASPSAPPPRAAPAGRDDRPRGPRHDGGGRRPPGAPGGRPGGAPGGRGPRGPGSGGGRPPRKPGSGGGGRSGPKPG